MALCELYEPKQVLLFICPIAISLATDRVADVRTIAFKLVSIVANKTSVKLLTNMYYFARCKLCQVKKLLSFASSTEHYNSYMCMYIVQVLGF